MPYQVIRSNKLLIKNHYIIKNVCTFSKQKKRQMLIHSTLMTVLIWSQNDSIGGSHSCWLSCAYIIEPKIGLLLNETSDIAVQVIQLSKESKETTG